MKGAYENIWMLEDGAHLLPAEAPLPPSVLGKQGIKQNV